MNDRTHRYAYAAGLVDGDGCIVIKGGKARKGYFGLFVLVTLVEPLNNVGGIPPALQFLQDTFGGVIGKPSKAMTKHGIRRRPCRQWYVGWQTAELMLTAILPYLIEKKEQAEVALEYRRVAMGRGKRALAEAYYLKLRALKNYNRRVGGSVPLLGEDK